MAVVGVVCCFAAYWYIVSHGSGIILSLVLCNFCIPFNSFEEHYLSCYISLGSLMCCLGTV